MYTYCTHDDITTIHIYILSTALKQDCTGQLCNLGTVWRGIINLLGFVGVFL